MGHRSFDPAIVCPSPKRPWSASVAPRHDVHEEVRQTKVGEELHFVIRPMGRGDGTVVRRMGSNSSLASFGSLSMGEGGGSSMRGGSNAPIGEADDDLGPPKEKRCSLAVFFPPVSDLICVS